MELCSIIASITSILVNIYTLWSVRSTLLNGAKEIADKTKEIIGKI